MGDTVGRATIEDLAAVTNEQSEFWGKRDVSHLHHPMLVHEFGQTSVVIRSPDGPIVAYLFGFVTLDERIAYAHLVAVRSSHRRRGLGRELYANFEALARERDAVALKAYTRPENTRSISFHRSIGMSATETADYAGPGESRVVFWLDLN